jgi:hypothetical protein
MVGFLQFLSGQCAAWRQVLVKPAAGLAVPAEAGANLPRGLKVDVRHLQKLASKPRLAQDRRQIIVTGDFDASI